MPHFGEHLTYDGYNGDYAALNCPETVRNALSDLVIAVGMTVLSGPEICFAAGNDKKDPGGWTGFVVVMESHISIHTFCYVPPYLRPSNPSHSRLKRWASPALPEG